MFVGAKHTTSERQRMYKHNLSLHVAQKQAQTTPQDVFYSLTHVTYG